ncbi:MAG: Clp protease N-terminal domain-containing protein [Gemmatimonadaceae bacterium]
MNRSHVGTEHLLAGLLAEEKGIAAQVLNERGATLAAVRAETLRLLGETPTLTTAPFTAPSTLIAVPPNPVHKSSGSLKPLSYSVEIEYDDGITVRRRCATKEEALSFLMTN